VKAVGLVVRSVVDLKVWMCHQPAAEPGTANVGVEAEAIVGMNEGENQARSWVVKEKRWQWKRVGVNGVLLPG
jgi:hypothetical protein